jgi:diguanylate cyclase (GGDEF)-like protein
MMPRSQLGVGRLVTGFAAGISLLLALAVPGTYYLAAHSRELARAHARGELIATEVAEIVARNPHHWMYQQARIASVLARRRPEELAVTFRVVTPGGTLVAEHAMAVQSPTFEASDQVVEGGQAVARIVAIQSLRPILLETGVVAALSLLLAGLAFVALRTLPLRALERAVTRAAHLAQFDTLTGLPNRALFRDRLQMAVAGVRRNGGAICVLCLDLDRFKEVNDTLGHPAGDRLLVQVAQRLRVAVRETDTVARLGGDEFAIVQVGAKLPEDADALARRLIRALSLPFDLDGHRATIGTSIGIAICDTPEADAMSLLRDADVALYQAKAEGRGTHCFFEAGMNQRLVERKRLEDDLRHALEEGQFRMAYQPLVELGADGRQRIVGAEALLRWRHPTRGDVRPDQFIALAESTRLIVQIGDWALREACRAARTWPVPLRVAVNVSPVQFRRPDFVAGIARALSDTDLPPERLELEITEGVLLTDTDATLEALTRLRALGVKIAMDDFGTGYSSLGYLRRFRFDKIKIDGSFVRHLGEDTDADAIVRAVLSMGHAMGMRVNAEGVESTEQAELLLQEGCGEMQGYLFGKPMPGEEFVRLLADTAGGSAPGPTASRAA